MLTKEAQEVKDKLEAEQKTKQENPQVTALQTQIDLLTATALQEKELREQEQSVRLKEEQTLKVEELQQQADLKTLLGNTTKESDDVEELSNKQLLDVIADAVEKSQDARDSQLKIVLQEATKPFEEKIVGVQKAVMQMVAVQGVKDVQARFTDFDEYREDIASVMQQIPGITVERAYLIAKTEKAGHVAPAKKIESERPNRPLTRPGASAVKEIVNNKREEIVNDGSITSFRSALAAGVNKAITRTE